MTACQEHNKFRKTSEWKSFRKMMLTKHPKCAYCNKPATVIHHNFVAKDEADYEDLQDESRFVCCCRQCHSLMHKLLHKKVDKGTLLYKMQSDIIKAGFSAEFLPKSDLRR